jgi:hypothetical protein
MSRHWRPDWTVVESTDYVQPKPRGRMAMLVLGTLFAGVAGGLTWGWWSSRTVASGPSSPAIEWNEVQPVPTRAPDAEDLAWQQRAAAQGAPVIASDSEAIQNGSPVSVTWGGAEQESGLPRAFSARNDRLYVIDGDTFTLGRERIRILGMDAPETHPSRCAQEAQLGNAAAANLEALLESGTVTMSGSGHDQYGRELRQVFVHGVDVAQTMIAAGLARSYDGGKKQGWC